MSNSKTTVDPLSKIIVTTNNETVKEIEISNPCQMWKRLDSLFEEFGHGARIQVLRQDGTLYKDWTHRQLKDGTWIKTNAIKETNRGYQMRLKREANEATEKAVKAYADTVDACLALEREYTI